MIIEKEEKRNSIFENLMERIILIKDMSEKTDTIAYRRDLSTRLARCVLRRIWEASPFVIEDQDGTAVINSNFLARTVKIDGPKRKIKAEGSEETQAVRSRVKAVLTAAVHYGLVAFGAREKGKIPIICLKPLHDLMMIWAESVRKSNEEMNDQDNQGHLNNKRDSRRAKKEHK